MNIIQMQDDLKGLPDQELVNEVQNPSGVAPVYLLLGELQRREKMRAEFAGQQQPTQTIAEQIIDEAIAPAPPMPMEGSPIPPGPGQAIPPAGEVIDVNRMNEVVTPEGAEMTDTNMLASTGVGALPAPNVGQYAEGGVVGFADGGFFGQGIKGAERRGVIEAVRPESQTAENYSTQARPQGLGGLAFMIKNKEGSPYRGFFKDAFGSHKYDRSEQSRLMKLIGKLGLFDQMEDQYMSKHGFDYPEYAQGGIVGFQNRGAVKYPGGNRLTYPYEAAPEVTDKELQNLIKAREANYPANMPGIETYNFARDDYGTIDGAPQGPANDPYTGALSTNVLPYQFREADAANVDMMDSFNEKIGRWVDDEPTTRINPMTGKEETYYGVNIDPLKEAAGDILNKIKMSPEQKARQGSFGINPDGEAPIRINDALGQWSDEEGEFTADPIWEAVENVKNLWRGRGEDEDVTKDKKDIDKDKKDNLPSGIDPDPDAKHWEDVAEKMNINKGQYQKLIEGQIADGGKSSYGDDKTLKYRTAEIEKMMHDMGIYDSKEDERAAKVAARIEREEARSAWNAVTMAGLSMMQGDSQFALTNIGKGIEDGIGAYEKSEQKIADLEDKKLELAEKKATRDRDKKIAALTLAVQIEKDNQTNLTNLLTAGADLESKANIALLNNETKKLVAGTNYDARVKSALINYSKVNLSTWSNSYDAQYPHGFKDQSTGEVYDKTSSEYQRLKNVAWQKVLDNVANENITYDEAGSFIESTD